MEVHTMRYDPTNNNTESKRPLDSAYLKTVGAIPGNIIAAIISTHMRMNDSKEPSWV